LDSDEDNKCTDQSKKIDRKYNESPVGTDRGLPPHQEPKRDKISKEQDRKRQASASPPPAPPGSRRRNKKERGMPKRPLSAYNFFFQKERPNVLQYGDSSDNTKKVSFENLAKIIGKRWGRLEKEDRKVFDKLAHKESIRYRKERKEFNSAKNISSLEQFRLTASSHIRTSPFPFANTPASFGNNNTTQPFHPSTFWPQQALIPAHHGPSPPLYPMFSERPEQQQQQLVQTTMQHQIVLQQAQHHRTNNSSFPQGTQLPPQLPHQLLHQLSHQLLQQPPQQLPPQHLPPQDLPPQLPPQQLPPQQQLPQQKQQQQQQQQPGAYAPQPAPMCPQEQREQPAPQPAPAGADTASPAKAMDPLRHPQSFPIPLGTEIALCDRNGVRHKYVVQYSLYSMKRDDAAQCMERLAAAFPQVPVEKSANAMEENYASPGNGGEDHAS
jgi:hypothetical protein